MAWVLALQYSKCIYFAPLQQDQPRICKSHTRLILLIESPFAAYRAPSHRRSELFLLILQLPTIDSRQSQHIGLRMTGNDTETFLPRSLGAASMHGRDIQLTRLILCKERRP